MDQCTLTVLTSPRDVAFVNSILLHLLRMSHHPFHEVIVVVDDLVSTSTPSKALPMHAALLSTIETWLSRGTISRCIRLSEINQARASEKYFGTLVSQQRDYRGVPLFGWIAGLEAAHTDLVVHFDSDIFLYQEHGHDWITEGITLLRRDPQVLFVAPLPGPPTKDKLLRGQSVAPTRDMQGNFRFKTFSSRRFLTSKCRLAQILPTPCLNALHLHSPSTLGVTADALCNWEQCVSHVLEKSEYTRVNLCSPKAWSLHSAVHDANWMRSVPSLIKLIERGEYPQEQAGLYDLIYPAWLSLLDSLV